jgi:alkanesulfonate monooxygenase SsuD/methylene tetrahydromethanopterin reductase-like flavin-dependent oxidoreductase (luciferase family)
MPGSLQFGLSLPNRAVLFGMPIETLLGVAARAEESGLFDSVWVGDNLLSKARLEAIVTLSALAARTRRVKLGTICLASFPLRHPLLLAIQWASLDRLSGGRTLLAVCAGGAASKGPQFAAELAAVGVASTERVARMEEGIELLRRFWAAEPVSFEGQFYRFSEVDAQPKPLQARPPIVIAVNPPVAAEAAVEERALRRVARLADGWQTDGVPPEIFARRWSRIREYAAEYGRADEVAHSSLHLMVNINDDAAQARRESVAFLDRYYGVGAVSSEKLDAWLAYGSPAAVIDRIAQFAEAGCTTPVLRFTADDQEGQLERCIAEVLPAFRVAPPAG